MFGLEKKKSATFEFDLEKELHETPTKSRELLKTVDGKIQEIKHSLREGTKTEDFDQLGILLHGYAALQKVLTRIANKK